MKRKWSAVAGIIAAFCMLIPSWISPATVSAAQDYALTPTGNGTVKILFNGQQVFANRPASRVFINLPEILIGKMYIMDNLETTSARVEKATTVYVITSMTSTGVIGQDGSLTAAGFTRDTSISPFRAFSGQNTGETAVVYTKACSAGETFTFSTWSVIAFGPSSPFTPAGLAKVNPTGGSVSATAGTVSVGGTIFSNRTHKFASTIPSWLSGTDYMYTGLGAVALTTVTQGWLYVLTPSTGSNSQKAALAQAGFYEVSELAAKILSTTITEPISVMGKEVSSDVTIEIGSWGVALCTVDPEYDPTEALNASLEAPAVQLYPNDAEYQDGNRLWQGIPGIEQASNGRLWTTWYSGSTTENEYNWVVLYTSSDDGKTWSGPAVVIDPDTPVRAFDPVLWTDPNGRLWFIWNQSYYHFDGRCGVWAIYTDNPEDANPTWSEPTRIANGITMNKPTVLSDGTWLLPTAIWGWSSWTDMGTEINSNVYASTDEGATWTYRGSVTGYEGGRNCDENMIIEHADGSLSMYIRTGLGIEESVSTDQGYTWSDSVDTNWTNVVSRFHIQTLSSGNLLLIYNNPPSSDNSRSYMTAAISTDGGETWPYQLVLDERANVSYPDATVDGDGNIYVIYDRDRYGDMNILMAVVTEADIMAGELVTPTSRLNALVNDNAQTWKGSAGYTLNVQNGGVLVSYHDITPETAWDNIYTDHFTHDIGEANMLTLTLTNYGDHTAYIRVNPTDDSGGDMNLSPTAVVAGATQTIHINLTRTITRVVVFIDSSWGTPAGTYSGSVFVSDPVFTQTIWEGSSIYNAVEDENGTVTATYENVVPETQWYNLYTSAFTHDYPNDDRLALTITNHGAHTTYIRVNPTDDSGGDMNLAPVAIAAGATQTIRIDLTGKVTKVVVFIDSSWGTPAGTYSGSVTISAPVFESSSAGKLVVAAVGDSITYGVGSSSAGTSSYPAQLQALLGDGYNVRNYGVSGSTALTAGNLPYTAQAAYTASLTGPLPDYVVIMLGTNDAKEFNWVYRDSFADDLRAIIASYQALSPDVKVILATSPTLYTSDTGWTDAVVSGEIASIQRQIAEETGCLLVDINAVTKNMAANFPDGIHPNDAGYTVLARQFYDAVLGLQAARAAETLIHALPAASGLTPAAAAALDTAQTAYDGLSAALRAQVTNADTLTAAQAAFAVYRPSTVGATIRGVTLEQLENMTGSQGLRFGVRFDSSLISPDNGYTVKSYGTVLITESKWLSTGGGELLVGREGSATVSGTTLPSTALSQVEYGVTVTNIPEASWDKALMARAYIVYEDSEGNSFTIYSATFSDDSDNAAESKAWIRSVTQTKQLIIEANT